MASIALVRPPQVMPVDALGISQGTPSIGVAYINGSLKKAGHNVTIVDALGEDLNTFHQYGDSKLLINGLTAEEIPKMIHEPVDIIAISCMFSNEWVYTKLVIKSLVSSFPNVPIIAGGEHITADPEFSLRTAPEIDVCVKGEGEKTIIEVIDAILNGDSFSNINGVGFIADGQYIDTGLGTRIDDIDKIAWPSWDGYPIENYLSQGFGFNQVRGRPMPVMASRGCPFRCTFCSSPQMWTTKWIARDPYDVVSEIKYYIDKYDIDHVEFYDLTAIIKKEWTIEFTELLIKENLEISWTLPSGTRSEALDGETLKQMKEAGCTRLTYAPESGSKATLKRIKKKVEPDRMIDSIRSAEKHGILVKSNFIFGFPDQTLYECWETYKFLFKLAWAGMHDVALFSFLPYPGSELYVQLQNKGKIPKDPVEFDTFLTKNVLGDFSMISWSDDLSSRQVKYLIIGAFFWFYCWSFLFRPQRLITTIWRFIRSRPVTTLDILIDGVKRNFIKGRKTRNINNIKETYITNRLHPLGSQKIGESQQ
jgi:radical SAM superfamily enzyme YgiQ (UPF0313 family)|tara:strand:+ start:1816 stop:3423 length:1608 start_codon:yes stop_codon:yes gene_type:complete